MKIRFASGSLSRATITKRGGFLWLRRYEVDVKSGQWRNDCWGWYFLDGRPVPEDLGWKIHSARIDLEVEIDRKHRAIPWKEIRDAKDQDR